MLNPEWDLCEFIANVSKPTGFHIEPGKISFWGPGWAVEILSNGKWSAGPDGEG